MPKRPRAGRRRPVERRRETRRNGRNARHSRRMRRPSRGRLLRLAVTGPQSRIGLIRRPQEPELRPDRLPESCSATRGPAMSLAQLQARRAGTLPDPAAGDGSHGWVRAGSRQGSGKRGTFMGTGLPVPDGGRDHASLKPEVLPRFRGSRNARNRSVNSLQRFAHRHVRHFLSATSWPGSRGAVPQFRSVPCRPARHRLASCQWANVRILPGATR